MKEIVLEIEESKYKFFLELISYFNFVTIRDEPGNRKLPEKIYKGIKQSDEGKVYTKKVVKQKLRKYIVNTQKS